MRTAEEKGKRARTDGAEGDGGEPIDRALLLSIEKLQEIQDEIEKVNEEASDKVLEVEQKYNKIRRPVYVRRNEIIQKIPDFWLTAFLSHPVLGDLLTEDDQQTFSSNPYFEDKKLTKTYSMSDDGTVMVKATSIKWKAGMDIVNGKACTKKGEKRLLVDQSSFFTWFNDAENGSFAHGEMDQVADIIKEDLWPNPLKYFNNELESEFEQEGDEEGSDEEEAEDDDEDEGDEEET
ncbi:NAP1-related protein 1-like isoform X3 [Panicum virgatum]|uniref:NAP1-related protein 1-like isoform X3 n=1 Tax=Panicum virgatum TaxID=38727 RepID=UPI0019D5774E|nr:NAP1-related protein 1-like isoform X3 [Panicum virgatum]